MYFLNGPNANLYGLDSSGTYGTENFPQIEQRCRSHAEELHVALDFRQTNHEGVLIDWIQEARLQADGLIINGAGLTYTSVAVLDALLSFGKPIIEVHMSNIYRREPFRHHSFISKAATGIVAGLGPLGYELAITALARLLAAGKAALCATRLFSTANSTIRSHGKRRCRRNCRTSASRCIRTSAIRKPCAMR
jgi:3-dehydroquinate dehydratase II